MHIYCITNLVNGKIYIGQRAYDDLQPYLRANIVQALKGSKCKPALYAAFRKYGSKNFVICSLVCSLYKEQMNALEKFFIRTLESRNPEIGYNIAEGGGVVGIPHTEEFKKKLSERNRIWIRTEETRKKIGAGHLGKPAHNRGKKMTTEQCKALSESMKGRTAWNKGKSWGAETRKKLSDNAKILHLSRERNPDGTFGTRRQPQPRIDCDGLHVSGGN